MFTRKGQSTLEYALIIAVVVGGLLIMQYYVKRGLSGRLKQTSDEIGEQYDPTTYTGSFGVSQSSDTRQTVQNKETRTTHLADQTNTRTGTETVGAWQAGEDLYKQ